MRTLAEYQEVMRLHNQGLNDCEIARQLKIPRGTIRDMIKKPNYHNNKPKANIANTNLLNSLQNPITQEDEDLQKTFAYVLSMYLGDGCLSLHRRKVYRLRVSLDAKYPNIINQAQQAVQILMPRNKVSLVQVPYKGKPSCTVVSCWSKDWTKLFPFYQT